MTQVDVAALAKLARLELSAEEEAKLATEIPAILGFVEEIQKVATDAAPQSPEHRNIMREDIDPIQSGTHTREQLAELVLRVVASTLIVPGADGSEIPAVIESPAPRWSNGWKRGAWTSSSRPSMRASAGSAARETTTFAIPCFWKAIIAA